MSAHGQVCAEMQGALQRGNRSHWEGGIWVKTCEKGGSKPCRHIGKGYSSRGSSELTAPVCRSEHCRRTCHHVDCWPLTHSTRLEDRGCGHRCRCLDLVEVIFGPLTWKTQSSAESESSQHACVHFSGHVLLQGGRYGMIERCLWPGLWFGQMSWRKGWNEHRLGMHIMTKLGFK